MLNILVSTTQLVKSNTSETKTNHFFTASVAFELSSNMLIDTSYSPLAYCIMHREQSEPTNQTQTPPLRSPSIQTLFKSKLTHKLHHDSATNTADRVNCS